MGALGYYADIGLKNEQALMDVFRQTFREEMKSDHLGYISAEVEELIQKIVPRIWVFSYSRPCTPDAAKAMALACYSTWKIYKKGGN